MVTESDLLITLANAKQNLAALQALLTTQTNSLNASNPSTVQSSASEHNNSTIITQAAAQLSHTMHQLERAEKLARQQLDLLDDVTNLNQTVELAQAKKRVEAILNNSADGILLAYVASGIQQSNATFNQLFACKEDDYFGKPLTSLVSEESQTVITNAVQSVLKTRQAHRIEIRAHRSNDTYFDAELGIGFMDTKDKDEVGLVCTIRDITTQKNTENELAEERNRLRTLIDSVPDHIYAKDLHHRFVLSNRALAFNHQFQTVEAILGKTDRDLFPPELAEQFIADEAVMLQSGKPQIDRVERSGGLNGGFEWSSSTKVPLHNLQGELVGLVGISRDITERKTLEQSIKKFALEISDLYNNAPCGYHSLDKDGFFVQINEVELNWLGYKRDEVIGKLKFSDVLTAKGKEAFRMGFPLFKKYGSVKDAEFDFVSRDGTIKTVLLNGTANYDEAGNFKLSSSTVYDITQLKQTERALRESDAKFRLMIESAPLAIVITDEMGQITLVNKQSEKLFGYTASEMIGHAVEMLLPENIRHTHVNYRKIYHTTAPAHTARGGLEFTARRKDGTIYPVEIDLSYIETHSGKLVMSFILDIRDRKERERQLRFNASLQENVMDAVIATDMNFTIQSWNKAAERIYGWSAAEAIGQNSGKLFKTRFGQGYTLQDYQKELLENGKWQREVVQSHKDGSDVHILSSITVFKDEMGTPLGVVGVNHDIGERKERERQLRFSASLQENVAEAVIATDMDFNVQSWNKAAEHIYGWTSAEAMGKPVSILRTEFTLGSTAERVKRDFLEKGYWAEEVIQHHKDGRAIHILSSVVLFKDELDNPIGVVSVNHDITARKQADEALQLKIESELEFQIYLKALHEISIELTQVDQLDDFYRRVVELGREQLGFDRLALFLYDAETNEAVGTYGTSLDGTSSDEHHVRFIPNSTGNMMRAFLQDERFAYDEDVELHHKLQPVGKGWNASAALWDGTQSIGWLVADNLINKQPASKALLDTLGLYAMSVATLLARKQTDAALRESETRYRLLAENITDVIVRLNSVGEILYVSPSSTRIMGYRPEEMVGRSGLEFISADSLAEAIARIDHAADGTAPNSPLVFQFPHKDGHLVWLEAAGQLITSRESGAVVEFIASMRDISERKRAEEAIKQALEKEKEVGELKSRFVSMTSHEFRTPLANILATTETLTHYRQKMSDPQIGQRLDTIRGQIDHLKDIMDDVLQLTRIDAQHVEYHPRPLNLDALCKQIIGEFDIRVDVPHQLIYRSQDVPAEMLMDQKLMRQLISNLISNAVKYSDIDQPIRVDLVVKNKVCILSVADKGIGIPEADLKHMFEPFHRATNVGTISGTGLGLIISRKAVELHSGTIAIQSQLGTGTTVIVEIPVVIPKDN